MDIHKPVNICFVANFSKTFLFHEIAQKLSAAHVGIFWIVTKKDQYTFLKSHYRDQQILYLNRSHVDLANDAVDDFRINELVFGDRVLKHEIQNGLKFLTNIQKPMYEFVQRSGIHFVFGEITWAHEVLLHRMTKRRKELKCRYLELSVVRIPNGRFAFFTDETQCEMLEFNQPSNAEIIKVEKPTYLKINDNIVRKNKSVAGRLKRLKRLFTGENIEANDPNVITNLFTRIKVATSEELNKTLYTSLKRTSLSEIEHANFVFLGFHKQPEASIDVSGRYHEDQALNVINLWRILPPGWKIVVKEHTNAIGDRSRSFYKKLLTYPGVVLVHETTDSKILIEKSKLVATVTGTIAYEAALLKKPAITFSPVFFNRINSCKFTPLSELTKYKDLTTLIDELNSKPDNRLEFSQYLMRNTFEGNISDPVTDPTVLKESNVQQICSAFLELFKNYD